MKRLLVLALAAAAGYLALEQSARPPTAPQPSGARHSETQSVQAFDALRVAFEQRRSNVWVEAEGRVAKVLKDDNDGSRHQRFIVELASGQTVLIAHNIDLAPRAPIKEGDRVAFRGEYEWNDKGGVVHWTHHDPQGRHAGGWIRANGQVLK